MSLEIILGILPPFAGTSLGAALVFLIKGDIPPKFQKVLVGFAAGIMVG